MGLLDKTLKIAKQASKVAMDAAGKKIDEIKKKREDENKIFVENIPYKFKYAVLLGDCDYDDFFIELERDSYAILDLDKDKNPIYIAKGTVLRGKHHFIVKNSNKEEVAKVHKHYVNFSIPVLEKERKTCSIELAGKEPFEMETYVELKDRQYYISKSGWKLDSSSNLIRETEFRFKKGRTSKPTIIIYKTSAVERKYILAFDNEEFSDIAACFAIGIDLIRFSD